MRDEHDGWKGYAIEINLRKGGTTAPYLIMQFLTDGRYDAEAGRFFAADNTPRYYVASDHVESEAYRAFNTTQIFDLVSAQGLHYNSATMTGAVLQMISDVGELGRLGATTIGRSSDEAEHVFDSLKAALTEEANRLRQGMQPHAAGGEAGRPG